MKLTIHTTYLQRRLAAAEFAAFINGEMRDLKATLDPNVASYQIWTHLQRWSI